MEKKKNESKTHSDSKLVQLLEPRIWSYIVVLLIFAGASCFFNIYVAAAEFAITLILLLVYLITVRRRRKEISKYIAAATGDVDAAGNDFMQNAPFPMTVFRPDTGEIIWANDRFRLITGMKEHIFDVKVSTVVPGFSTTWLQEGKSEYPGTIDVGERKFAVFGHIAKTSGRSANNSLIATTYWLDVTDELAMKEEYYGSRPVMAIIVIDNYDELTRNLNDNHRSILRAQIDEKLEEWVSPADGLFLRYERDRYLFVFEERYLNKFQSEKFSVLDSVHKVVSPRGIPASLSLGIGMDTDYSELFEYATLAVDMALSRGGDQAVIKNRFNFEFYGGRSVEMERRTKVKSRVMANSLASLITSASTVYIMGHKYTDLDAIGAAVGVAALARKIGVKAQIVVEDRANPASLMVKRMQLSPEYRDTFITAETAIVEADNRSLLVVVDTNRPEQVVAESLLMSCNKIAVIDHHRRSASYIENAALNYHETAASSASELVTELLEYQLEAGDLMRSEAEALLAGIVLDTKSFTLRTGGGTFEAAAFLRRNGADTVEVKRLFQTTLPETVAKFDIVTRAKHYRKDVAIVCLEHTVDRVTAAQAADELLNVEEINASFVLFPDDQGRIIISGRSIGDTNVQVILEALGGGGNLAVAGAQVKDSDLKTVLAQLEASIDAYFGVSKETGEETAEAVPEA